MKIADDDHIYMARAIDLACKGLGQTAPNPIVGAVIVKEGHVIGGGYHKAIGAAHAEVAAITTCRESPVGATLYVTLEPCNHQGRTGPCTEAIIDAGINTVIVGARDQSPKKGLKGIARLKRAGITVVYGVMKKECEALVADFHTLMTTGRPFITVKTAMTLDGKVASSSGDSKWITSKPALKKVHQLRATVDAVMVGIGTVLADDPELTARKVKAPRQPLRVVVDSRLRIPEDSRLVTAMEKAPLVVVTTDAAPKAKIKRLESRGVAIVSIPANQEGRVDLPLMLDELGSRGFMHILVEAGGELSGALLDAGLIDRALFFIAPKIVGGKKSAMAGSGIGTMAQALALTDVTIETVGPDVMIAGTLRPSKK